MKYQYNNGAVIDTTRHKFHALLDFIHVTHVQQRF